MNTHFLKTLGLLLALATAPMAAGLHAQTPPPDPAIVAIASSPEFKAFLDNLRTALDTQDSAKLKSCFHPKSLAIVEADPNTPAKFAKRFANPIPNECNVSILPIGPMTALPFADKGVVFPVRPSHQLQIKFIGANGQPTTLIIFVIQEKGKWYEVVPSTPSSKS